VGEDFGALWSPWWLGRALPLLHRINVPPLTLKQRGVCSARV
jgi:hypothetical protein